VRVNVRTVQGPARGGQAVSGAKRLVGDYPAAVPEETFDSLALQPHVESLERRLIQEALLRSDNNKSAAARGLQISERSLWYKIKKYGL